MSLYILFVEVELMKNNRLRLPACLLLLLFSGLSFAQGSQTSCDVQGAIVGPGYKPIGNVLVILQTGSGAQIARTTTTTDGRYTFFRVAPGNYSIEVSPNETQYQKTMVGGIVCNEPLRGSARESFINQPVSIPDIMLRPVARIAEITAPGVVFAQDVPPAAEGEYKQAEDKLAKGKKDEAVNHLNRALEIFPNYFIAAQKLGLVYLEMEQYRQAVVPLQKAINVNPKAAPAYLGIGMALVNLDRPEVALEALKEAQTLNPGSWRVHLYSGIALLNLGRLDEAEKSLKEAFALGGAAEGGSAHLYLASVYDKRKQYKEAVSELETYLKENPKAPNAENIKKVLKNMKSKM
jgi:Flp pilus assembly protein TadD